MNQYLLWTSHDEHAYHVLQSGGPSILERTKPKSQDLDKKIAVSCRWVLSTAPISLALSLSLPLFLSLRLCRLTINWGFC